MLHGEIKMEREIIIKTHGDKDAGILPERYIVELGQYEFEDDEHREAVVDAARELGVALTGEAVRVHIHE